MFRVIAVTALAAFAAAQSEFSASDGAINIETREGVTVARRQQISVFDLSSVVANLESQFSASNSAQVERASAQVERAGILRAQQESENSLLRLQMAALGGSDSPLALGVQAIANDMQARTADLLTAATANTNRLNTLEGAVSTAQVAVATVPSTLAATVATMTNTMDSRINGVLASLASTGTALRASSASTATALRASQTAGASTLTASVNAQLTRVNTSIRAVTVALVGKRSAASHMWVGSCSNNGNGGWREYCFDRALHDSARPMFRKENNNRMRSILAGYYHVQFHRMNQTCNWEHTLLYFDGTHRVHTHDWQGGNSRWRDSHASLVYPLAANKQFYARAWNSCWSNWYTTYYHTQFFAMYVGAIPA